MQFNAKVIEYRKNELNKYNWKTNHKTQFYYRKLFNAANEHKVNQISYCPACNRINFIDFQCVNSVTYSISLLFENKQRAQQFSVHSFTRSLWKPILPCLVYLLLNFIFHLVQCVNCHRRIYKNWHGVENFASILFLSHFFSLSLSFGFEYFSYDAIRHSMALIGCCMALQILYGCWHWGSQRNYAW